MSEQLDFWKKPEKKKEPPKNWLEAGNIQILTDKVEEQKPYTREAVEGAIMKTMVSEGVPSDLTKRISDLIKKELADRKREERIRQYQASRPDIYN